MDRVTLEEAQAQALGNKNVAQALSKFYQNHGARSVSVDAAEKEFLDIVSKANTPDEQWEDFLGGQGFRGDAESMQLQWWLTLTNAGMNLVEALPANYSFSQPVNPNAYYQIDITVAAQDGNQDVNGELAIVSGSDISAPLEGEGLFIAVVYADSTAISIATSSDFDGAISALSIREILFL